MNSSLIPRVLPIVCLLWAFYPGNPYDYYIVLRIVCCTCFSFLATRAFRSKQDGWLWTFGALAVLYNPFIKLGLDRTTWTGVNLITILIITYSVPRVTTFFSTRCIALKTLSKEQVGQVKKTIQLLLMMLLLAGCVFWYKVHQDNVEAERIASEARRSSELKFMAAQRKQEELKRAQDELEAEAKRQLVLAAAHRESLKTPKTWIPQRTGERRVYAKVQTYWRDGAVILRFQLSGPPEFVEIASGRHKRYQITFKSNEHLPLFDTSIDGIALKPHIGKSGGITELVSEPLSISLSQAEYEEIASWSLKEF